MKVVILAGGFGSRLSEYTEIIPKPMVNIGNDPILMHIIKIYAKFGYNDFYIALGYKSDVIIDYFMKYKYSEKINNSNDENITSYQLDDLKLKINLIHTGKNAMTGGRLKRLEKYIGKQRFMLTYGDGLSDINLHALSEFHTSHGKLATVTAVRPPARFGVLQLNEDKVISFKEKSQLDEGWINGGFFIIEPEFFSFIKNDETFLEREPLEKAASLDQLRAYKHNGFWQCMDTKRDKDKLESMYITGDIKWEK